MSQTFFTYVHRSHLAQLATMAATEIKRETKPPADAWGYTEAAAPTFEKAALLLNLGSTIVRCAAEMMLLHNWGTEEQIRQELARCGLAILHPGFDQSTDPKRD